MSGFSADWLTLREPVDHRSRDANLAEQLRAHVSGRATLDVVDLGCGTGSNLRGTYHLLPAVQRWTLVDYDPLLLDAARADLTHWADRGIANGDALLIEKQGRKIAITFRQADLNQKLDDVIGPAPDLVTAAAFFDLASPEFIGRIAAAVSTRRAIFFTTLTYNGQQTWSPPHAADRAMLDAFHAHQAIDKGFGPSAGPAAPPALSTTFQAAGYHVSEGDSPWRLGGADRQLIADLAHGFASAAAETGLVREPAIADWRAQVRTAAEVGHTDTLAFPAT